MTDQIESKVNAKPNPTYALYMFSDFHKDASIIVGMFEKKYGYPPEEVHYHPIHTPEVPEELKGIAVEDKDLLKNTLHAGPIKEIKRSFETDGTE